MKKRAEEIEIGDTIKIPAGTLTVNATTVQRGVVKLACGVFTVVYKEGEKVKVNE